MKITRNIKIPGPHQRPILLDVYYQNNAQRKPVIIFSHGFKGFKDWGHWDLVAREFAKNGFVFVKFNFSHNGVTENDLLGFGDLQAFGNNNFPIELDDLGAVIDFIISENSPVPESEIDKGELYLTGHSRGGGIIILKANEDPRVKKIVTWASVHDYKKFWGEDFIKVWKEKGVQYVPNARTGQLMPLYWQLYENYQNNLARLHIPTAMQNLQIPIMLVHCTADQAVPYDAALEMARWNVDAKLLTIEGGDHTFGGKHPWDDNSLPQDMKKVVKQSISFFHHIALER